MFKLYCPSCQPTAINGTPVHERGCPHGGEAWVFRRRSHRGVKLEQPVCIPEDAEVPAWLRDEADVDRMQPDHGYAEGEVPEQ